MLRRIILALIGLLAVVNGSKWLFDGKRLPTLGLAKDGVMFIVLQNGLAICWWLRKKTRVYVYALTPSP